MVILLLGVLQLPILLLNQISNHILPNKKKKKKKKEEDQSMEE